MAQYEESPSEKPVVHTTHVILNHFVEKYPSRYSAYELTLVLQSERISPASIEEALADLRAYGLLCLDDYDDYSLSGTVRLIAKIGWSPFYT